VAAGARRFIIPLMVKYTLPELRYDYGALEPHISGKIMELHHDKHHAAYVKGANQALDGLAEARAKNDFTRIAALERQLGFHLSGHVLHSLFWQNLAPKSGGQPAGDLGEQVKKDFGSFDGFKAQLTNCAMTIMGSGWAALAWDPLAKRLITMQIHDHQSEVAQSSTPLLVIDAWEHAYYLQYMNDKAKFFDAVWNVFHWEDVAQRLTNAKKLELGLHGVIALK
jgi:Fe-Mn family superoxide dismutase